MADFSYNRMLKATNVEDFVGIITRRDPDGYGVVEFRSPERLDHKLGIFTREVFQDPEVSRRCKVGKTVTGRVHDEDGGFRILRLEPEDAAH